MSKDEPLVLELIDLLGQENVIIDDISLKVYECDGAEFFKALPDVVVFPDSAEEISQIVKLANIYNKPYIARGAGTGLSGGTLPINAGIMIAMNKMNRILEVDLENRQAVIEPGVVNLMLTQAVQDKGYHYAPDPSSQQACSIGGNIAENSGGPHTLKYGVTTNHILGMEVVLPNGEIIEFGGPIEEDLGYDLRGLMIGSEGTFGIVTKAIVRLTRNPQAYYTMLGIFETIDNATNAVSNIIADGIVPAALEMMDNFVIRAVEEAFSWGLPTDAGAVLIVELDGVEVGMSDEADQIIRILVSKKYDIPIANVFHAGDGNLHPIVLFDKRDSDQVERVHMVNKEILQACVDVGGTISGEHGIGVEKQEFMPLIFSKEDMDLMVTIRNIFNPKQLCNPKKIFPIDETTGVTP